MHGKRMAFGSYFGKCLTVQVRIQTINEGLSLAHRIIYFYIRKNACYKQKLKNSCISSILFSEKELGDIKACYCGLPEYYEVRKGWKKEKKYVREAAYFLEILQKCCEHVSAESYYLEEDLERQLMTGKFSAAFGKQRMCGSMIKHLTGQFRGIDAILYEAEEGEEPEQEELSFNKELVRKLHYFFYMGERTEKYTVMEDALWKEYGMPLIWINNVQDMAECRINRLLVLDDRKSGNVEWRFLQKDCVYIDLWSDREKKEEIMRNRADIKYISERFYLTKNLDTPWENGYNAQSSMI